MKTVKNVLSSVFTSFMLVILFQFNGFSQCGNLIPNGSFEDFSSLPNDDCDWELAVGWSNAATSNACNTTNGTPDYFHTLGEGIFSSLPSNYFATLNPFEGNAVMGLTGTINLVPDFREYISIPLSNPLIIGQSYTLKFSLTTGTPNTPGMFVNGWGATMTNGPVFQNTGTSNVIPISNFDFIVPNVINTTTWETFTFTFIATEAFTHFTFGNFLSTANQTLVNNASGNGLAAAYVFIDGISLTPENAQPLLVDIEDETICPGQTIVINPTITGGVEPYSLVWSNPINSTSSSVSLSPETTTQYSLTVTDCNGISSTGLFTVAVENQNDFVDLGPDNVLCSDPVLLNATTIGAVSYLWNTGSTSAILSVNEPGVYSVQVSTSCFIYTDTVSLSSGSTVVPSFINSVSICEGDSVFIGPVLDESINFVWLDGAENSPRRVNKGGAYFLVVTDDCGETSYLVNVQEKSCECYVYVPNAFTPNQNGLNETFGPSVECEYSFYRFNIWNRWGEKIFASDSPDKRWSGLSDKSAEQTDNLYIWDLTIKSEYAEQAGNILFYRGMVSILK